ncbi:hypothetical protein H0178_44940 [Cytobacillus firmus]|nr:hypothetical protein [Cytobacillus firmus]
MVPLIRVILPVTIHFVGAIHGNPIVFQRINRGLKHRYITGTSCRKQEQQAKEYLQLHTAPPYTFLSRFKVTGKTSHH